MMTKEQFVYAAGIVYDVRFFIIAEHTKELGRVSGRCALRRQNILFFITMTVGFTTELLTHSKGAGHPILQ